MQETETTKQVTPTKSPVDIERSEIEQRFGPYRKPTDVTIPKYKAIQEKTLELALLIQELCPYSKQKATALTHLEACKMSANASIAIYTPAEVSNGN